MHTALHRSLQAKLTHRPSTSNTFTAICWPTEKYILVAEYLAGRFFIDIVKCNRNRNPIGRRECTSHSIKSRACECYIWIYAHTIFFRLSFTHRQPCTEPC